jgi:hypothetical protein
VREFITRHTAYNKHDTGWAKGAPSEDHTTPPSSRTASGGRLFFVGAGVAFAALAPWSGTHVKGLERENWLAPHVECCEVRVRERTAVLVGWRPTTEAGLVVWNQQHGHIPFASLGRELPDLHARVAPVMIQGLHPAGCAQRRASKLWCLFLCAWRSPLGLVRHKP